MKKIILFLIFILLPASCFAAGQIDINTASLQQLDELTGIGPTYAQRIIDARPFSSVDDLIRVSGIGEKTLQNIKDQGLACVNCPPAQADQTISEARPPENLQADSVEVGPLPNYPSGIIINEIMPNPEGADETEEWIVTTTIQIASIYS